MVCIWRIELPFHPWVWLVCYISWPLHSNETKYGHLKRQGPPPSYPYILFYHRANDSHWHLSNKRKLQSVSCVIRNHYFCLFLRRIDPLMALWTHSHVMPAAKLHLSFESYHIGGNCCSRRRWLGSVRVKFFSYHADLMRSCPDLSCSYLNPLGESRNASSRCEGLLEEDKRLPKPMRKIEESSYIFVLPNPVLPMFLSFGLAPLKACCWAAWVWLWRGNTCHWVMAVCKDYFSLHWSMMGGWLSQAGHIPVCLFRSVFVISVELRPLKIDLFIRLIVSLCAFHSSFCLYPLLVHYTAAVVSCTSCEPLKVVVNVFITGGSE